MRGLQRLIYRSQATGSTASLLNVATILAESQRNNERDGLTGALAAHGECYIQVIEGQAQALDSLLRRLERDNRHRRIEVLDRRDIDGRRFAGWTMAHARVNPATAPALDRLMSRDPASAAGVVELLEAMIVPGRPDPESLAGPDGAPPAL